jgi:hypothetical protein
MSVFVSGITALIALVFAIALLDQWRVRRQSFQLSWAIGMLFLGIASGCETIAAANGWSEPLYRTWYLTSAVWTAGWLGLGPRSCWDGRASVTRSRPASSWPACSRS